jgi:hypothetical protein
MQSFWDYLRLKSRDSVLAGLQEAIDIVEGDGSNQHEEHAAAMRYLERHGRQGELEPAASRTLEAAPQGEESPGAETLTALAEPEASPRHSVASQPAERPTLAARISLQMRSESQPLDPFEQRLQQTNPTLNPTPEPTTPPSAPRKRGRPRKNP